MWVPGCDKTELHVELKEYFWLCSMHSDDFSFLKAFMSLAVVKEGNAKSVEENCIVEIQPNNTQIYI